MKVTVKSGGIADVKADAVIVNLFAGVKNPAGGTGAMATALGGKISALIKRFDFDGGLGENLSAERDGGYVIVQGLGKASDFGAYEITQAAATALRKAESLKCETATTLLHGAGIGGLDPEMCAEALTIGAYLGNYKYNKYKTGKAPCDLKTLTIVENDESKIAAIKKGIKSGTVIAEAVMKARDLANESSNIATPTYLADTAKKIAEKQGLECEVLGRKEIIAGKMGLLAAVSKGASQDPKFIKLFYKSPGAKKTIALVGKGITFDTGGYSLKKNMYTMNGDMTGAADVLAAMEAIGKIKPKVNVVGLVPATENSIGPDATHPGDVAVSLDGQTVEIFNTDAEGRLILADALTVARLMKVDEIIDVATLTGACSVALGDELSGILGTGKELIQELIACGRQTGELYWEMPYYMGYKKRLKSKIADMKNTSKSGGGCTEAALFLGSFVGDIPWAHLDLSACDSPADRPLADAGMFTAVGTGAMVKYIMKYAK